MSRCNKQVCLRFIASRKINIHANECSNSGNLKYSIDFHRDIARQRRRANRGARMAADVAENFNHQVGGAINNLRLLPEVRYTIDKAGEAHASNHAVKIAIQGRSNLGKNIESAQARRLLALLDCHIGTQFAGIDILAIEIGNLSGDEYQLATSV